MPLPVRLALVLATLVAATAPTQAAPLGSGGGGDLRAASSPCTMRPIHSLPGRGHIWGSITRPVGDCGPQPVALAAADTGKACPAVPIHSLPGRGHVWGSITRPATSC